MPDPQAAEHRLPWLDRDPRRDHAIERARNPLPGRVVAGEPRAREREIGIDRQPRREPRVVGPLDANPPAWPARFGRPCIADEQQLGVDPQVPQRDGRLQTANANRAQADLRALRAHQRRHAFGRRPADRIDRDRRATGVVAVEARAGIHVQLGSAPRAEDCADLGTHQAIRAVA